MKERKKQQYKKNNRRASLQTGARNGGGVLSDGMRVGKVPSPPLCALWGMCVCREMGSGVEESSVVKAPESRPHFGLLINRIKPMLQVSLFPYLNNTA